MEEKNNTAQPDQEESKKSNSPAADIETVTPNTETVVPETETSEKEDTDDVKD